MIERAVTGKEIQSPRLRYHNKGRAGKAYLRTARLYLKVRPMTAEEQGTLQRFSAKNWPTSDSKARLNPRAY
jgi:hypothetical protein